MLSEDQKAQFVLDEINARRVEIQSRIGRVESDMQYGLLSSGGLWAWILTDTTRDVGPWIAWLPAIITVFFFAKWLAQDLRINGIGSYLKDVESQLNLPDGLGWETNRHQYTKPRLAGFTTCFWSALLLGNVIGVLTICMPA